jgi:hypothetical protein
MTPGGPSPQRTSGPVCLPLPPGPRRASYCVATSIKRTFLAMISRLMGLVPVFRSRSDSSYCQYRARGGQDIHFFFEEILKPNTDRITEVVVLILNADSVLPTRIYSRRYSHKGARQGSRQHGSTALPSAPLSSTIPRCVCDRALRVRELWLPSMPPPTRAVLKPNRPVLKSPAGDGPGELGSWA